MRRTLPLIAVLVGLLACSASALAARAGFNVPSKKLEAAFKVALYERAGSADGCYMAPAALAPLIKEREGFKTGVAASFKSVPRSGIVYVIKRGAACDRVLMAIRYKGELWVLDSLTGLLTVKGREKSPDDDSVIGNIGPLRALTMATKTFTLTRPEDPERFDVRCPGKTYPLGGGMVSSPPLGADGEGAYPHSFERLGVQRGWHISVFLLDPSKPGTTPRKVTLQVVCGLGLVPMSAPHKTVFIKFGETKTAIARCPKGQYLMSGGFQRTDFLIDGGNYITESRAIGPKAWRVTGSAHGAYGGELTTLAYCVRNKGPLLKQVSASTPLPFGASATATTPPCPKGQRLTLGGFSANGSHETFFADGSFNSNGTWSATGFGYFGAAPSLTAYGYCLRI